MQQEKLIVRRKWLRGEDNTRVFSVRLREDLLDALDKLSDESGRSRNELINQMVSFGIQHSIVMD